MLSNELLEKLVFYSNEEIDNLNGLNKIDRSIFTTSSSNIIDSDKLLGPDEQIAIRKHARFCDYPVHSHNYIELIYVYHGQIRHIIEGNEVVQNKGEFLLLNQHAEHGTRYADEDDIAFNFIIKPAFLEYLSMMITDEGDISNFLFRSLFSNEYEGNYLIFKTSDCADVIEVTERIIENIYTPSVHKNLRSRLLVGLLLTRLMEYPEKTIASTYDSAEMMVMNTVYKYVHYSYREGSLAQLCQMVHMPDYQLCKIIKKKTKKTFKEMIQEERLKQCAIMLEVTPMAIMDVMEYVGYDNPTYFYKIFRKHFSCTPKEYRAKFRSEN